MAAAFVHAERRRHVHGDQLVGGSSEGAHSVRVQRISDAVLLTPQGVLDDAVLGAVDRAVSAAGRTAVILDLSVCALTRTSVLEQVDGRRWARSTVRIVCPRGSARRLLALARVTERLPLFRSVEEATAPDGA